MSPAPGSNVVIQRPKFKTFNPNPEDQSPKPSHSLLFWYFGTSLLSNEIVMSEPFRVDDISDIGENSHDDIGAAAANRKYSPRTAEI
jgi:hypothetical protein